MSDKTKAELLKYGICAGVTALMVWGFLSLRDPFSTLSLVEKYRTLCDAFTIPGVLLLCVGGLSWASSLGALDGLAYVFHVLGKSLIPGKRIEIRKYSDYVLERREKESMGFGFLLISGAVVLGISLVFLILFYSVYGK